ncbi:MAG: hypothetical protein A3C36_07605 [Omnitrophica WOR_2 bacterium RIFCSPHIGHO2_02_FULL_52_10]|nr:MAG: hypothetical protein A3C36_07605 [Omnitrophica WOR_2 bacterium RIFCSPHIGHO2_02_FULL_52_10]
MNLKQLTAQFCHLRVNEKRTSSPGYEEWVIYAEDLGKWNRILSDLLGPAVKPKGEKTTQEAFALTVKFGGILEDQILYHKKIGGVSVVAMLWPWKNNVHVTIKMASFKSGKGAGNPDASMQSEAM